MQKFILSKRAKYIDKYEEESGNITYVYSPKHIKERTLKKAKKILYLAKSIKKLRNQVLEDLKDPEKHDLALAVALMDETFERVGNVESAKELKHFGVTTWQKKHIKFKNGSAVLSYVGKSGVKQKKTIKNKVLVKELKSLIKDKKPGDKIFSCSDDNINAYLKPFKITAKDIRGYHANFEMKKQLQKIHKSKDPKELKAEFKKALEETAKLVGHNPSTLKNQYLVPSIEENFLKGGKIKIKASFKISYRQG